MFYRYSSAVGLSLLSFSSHVSPSSAQNIASSVAGSYAVLQTWYNSTSGLWNTAGWWNAANIVTMLGDYATVNSTAKSLIEPILSNTFVQAQIYDLEVIKDISTNGLVQSFYNDPLRGNSNAEVPPSVAVNPTGFTDDFYDDDGWWALAWIQAYDVYGNQTYLTMAEDIFAAMQLGGNTNCSSGGSGIWWSNANSYVNAIANELYLSVSAHLANRVAGTQGTKYLNIALNQWTWFQNSGMINSQNLINDGLSPDCTNNGETTWTYNQGVILGALVELNKASPNSSFLTSAKAIASAAIENLAVDGILHETCEPDCGSDGTQFKGVFMRNLGILNQAAPETDYANFITDNADSIVERDSSGDMLSVSWAGPFVSPANASTQSSAMDALVAALILGG